MPPRKSGESQPADAPAIAGAFAPDSAAATADRRHQSFFTPPARNIDIFRLLTVAIAVLVIAVSRRQHAATLPPHASR